LGPEFEPLTFFKKARKACYLDSVKQNTPTAQQSEMFDLVELVPNCAPESKPTMAPVPKPAIAQIIQPIVKSPSPKKRKRQCTNVQGRRNSRVGVDIRYDRIDLRLSREDGQALRRHADAKHVSMNALGSMLLAQALRVLEMSLDRVAHEKGAE